MKLPVLEVDPVDQITFIVATKVGPAVGERGREKLVPVQVPVDV